LIKWGNKDKVGKKVHRPECIKKGKWRTLGHGKKNKKGRGVKQPTSSKKRTMGGAGQKKSNTEGGGPLAKQEKNAEVS